ncbi:MAG: RNA polymerase sigma factor, partial [Ruminiclostridium sp.]|nr:RNA polymerase sigma factor [Ruminiclostridium sp.]
SASLSFLYYTIAWYDCPDFAGLSTAPYSQLSLDEDSLEHSYIKEEERITLHKAMSKLKPQYCQVLWLVYFEDFSHKETARIMKKPVGSIKTLVFRARQELKSQLEKEGFDYNENI